MYLSNSSLDAIMFLSFNISLVSSKGKPYVSYNLKHSDESSFLFFSVMFFLIIFSSSFKPFDNVFKKLSVSFFISFNINSSDFKRFG